ncbi:MAG: hypothetical protein LVR00_09880 [Rhabdochlamydiaceae bacterium]|jgi:hypothetical protein
MGQQPSLSPFLFVPWIDSAWIVILSFGLYMMFYRAGFTVWIETIKTKMPPPSRERLMGFSSALDYGLTALLTFALGPLLDRDPESWRLLFPLTAFLGLISTYYCIAFHHVPVKSLLHLLLKLIF